MSAPEENKKRVLSHQDGDGDIDAAIRNKRAALNPSEGRGRQQQYHQQQHHHQQQPQQHNYSIASEKFYFKILCPQSITGIIIGKGGSTINQLNGSTGCSIKLSHNNEYYPGTNDRILLCHGTKEALQLAIDELVTKIAEAAEKKYPTEPRLDPFPPNRSADGSYLVRVLIPRNSEGALIGKGGLVVRQMTSETGCNFQLGLEDTYGTNERIFILTSATVHSVVNGAAAVLHNLINSPKIRTYVNTGTSYGMAPSNGMSAPQSMMPYQQQQPQHGYVAAPMLAAPGMVMMPAPVYGMPQQQPVPVPVQYMQAMPPQMTVPGGAMVPMAMQPAPMVAPQGPYVPQQQLGYGQQPQQQFQAQQGGYNFNQGRTNNPSRHAGGPNGSGRNGGAGGQGQGQNQGQGQGQGQNQGHNNTRFNKYGGGGGSGAPAGQQQQQQQGYPVQQHQTAPVYQQQPQQQQGSAGQYPAQQQQHAPQAQAQVVPQQQQQAQQYLYPTAAIPGMPLQQQQPVYQPQQQQQQQQQTKPAHQAYGAPQQQAAYGQQPQQLTYQQPAVAASTAAAGAYPAYADPQTAAQTQVQQHQYAPQQQQQQGVMQAQVQGYPQQQQQQQYTQYAMPGQAVAGAVPQQYAYAAAPARK